MAQSRGRRAQHRTLTRNPLRTPKEFSGNLRRMMRRFVLGQSELLLTAGYLAEQESTLNSRSARTGEAIHRTFPDLSDDDVQLAVELLNPLLLTTQSPRPEKESEQEARNEEFKQNLADIAIELEVKMPPGHAYGCIDAALQTMGTGDRLSRVSASLLISLVAEFEVLVANLFGELFRCFPDSTISSDKPFSWELISSADTMELLKDQIIEEAVTSTMYSTYTTWLDKFETFDIDVPPVARTSETKEIFQRRHVIVHNGGRVSAIYLRKTDVEPAPPLNSLLNVPLAYLTSAADRLFAVAARLYAEVVRKIFEDAQDERERLEGLLAKCVYELLSHRRFEALVMVIEAIDIASLVDPLKKKMVTVNGWLALKGLDRFEECRADVESWDTDAEPPQFLLAKLALLDRTDEGLKLIDEIRGTKHLSIESWATWPLLDGLRKAENTRALERAGVQDTLAGVDEMLNGGLS